MFEPAWLAGEQARRPDTHVAFRGSFSLLKSTAVQFNILGASWFTVMWRVIVPNISGAILNAAFLSVALVLGEYTIANNLLYNNLRVELVHLGRDNAGVSVAVAVASLLFAFVLLVAIAFIGGRPRRVRPEAVTTVGIGPTAGSPR